jgi:trk system potassium uptake protein TrkA
MYIVVAGAGHMGTHLVSRLVAAGHETVVIDVDKQVTDRLFAEHGVVVFTGSATDVNVLDQAGIKRAAVAVAMTGRDADNLAFCLLARYYGVPRVLARMLNPQYQVPYRLVGATKIHSEADILVESFLTSIDSPEIGSLMPVGKGDIVVFDVAVSPTSAVAGKPVATVVRSPDFPRGCLFIATELPNGNVQVIEGNTVIAGGARVIMAAHRPDLPKVLRYLTATDKAAPAGSQAEVMDALGQVAFLSGVAHDDLSGLAEEARLETRRAGDEIYKAGEAGDRFFVLRRGAMELEGASGARAVVKAPAFFGEEALTGEPRHDTARVTDQAELVVVPGTALRATVLRNPFLALELAKALSERPASDQGR